MTTPPPSPYLYVFLDEGGDLNFSPTGTKFYTLTTVTTTRPFAWDGPMMSLKYQFIEQGLNLECFHAAEDRQAVRDKVQEAIEKGIKQTLSAMLPAGTKYRVLHHASKSCVSLQVADYCNWAIFRKWDRGDLRSYDLIKSALKSEFDIFRSGTKNYY